VGSMTAGEPSTSRRENRREITPLGAILFVIGAAFGGLVVPGGGLLIAFVALFTRARSNRALMVTLFTIGVVLVILDIGLIAQPHSNITVKHLF
jgi:hypothetical protein